MKRLILVGVVLALVCAAGGSASSPGAKASAVREAQRLLDAYVPPPGAVPLDAVQHGERLPVRIPEILGKRIDRHRLWRVPATVGKIAATFEAPLPGWRGAAVSSYEGNHGLSRSEATFTALGFGGRATGRLLNLTAVPARGGGSLLRADVVVVWQLSAAERQVLPAGIREIDIRGPWHGVTANLAQVRNSDQVRTIVRWFDHLELYEPRFFLSCPVQRPQPTFTFDFRGRHGTLARASVPEFASGCSPASYTIRGHEQTFPLLAKDFDFRVQSLLGANWMGPPDMLGRADQREREATRRGVALMRAFRPPPGATRIPRPKYYGGALFSVGSPFGEFVRRTRYWHVDAKISSVVGFLQGHDVPDGFKASCGGNSHFGSARCDVDTLPAGSRTLEFTVQRTRDGTSILRVDANVVWVYPRSPKESVRASRVRAIDFSAPKVSKHITDRDQIARIVRSFNRLPIVPPGVGSSPGCVMQTVPVTLDFRDAHGKPLARVSADVTEPYGASSACNPMSVTIAGAPQPSLISPNFFGRVQRAIGVTVS